MKDIPVETVEEKVGKVESHSEAGPAKSVKELDGYTLYDDGDEAMWPPNGPA